MSFYIEVELQERTKQTRTYEQDELIRGILDTYSKRAKTTLRAYIESYQSLYNEVPPPGAIQHEFQDLTMQEIVIAWEQARNYFEGGDSF